MYRCAARRSVGDFLVAARERHRLERQEVDLLRVVERELDDPADLLVVHAVDDRRDGDDVDAGGVQILDRAQLHVEQVADEAVRVRRIADAVELQVRVPQPRLGRRLRELGALGELDPVGRRLDAAVPDLLRVAHRVEEVRRHRRLAARELDRHLALRLERDRVVEQRLDVLPRQLVHEPDLVRVHEARIAHHVAAVREVDREDRAAAVLDGARAVVVQLLVVVRPDVAAREGVLEVLEERRIDRHDVLEAPVNRALLHHQDLAVPLDDLGLDLAHLLLEQNLVVALAVENLLARLADAGRTERVGLARPAERRLHLLPRFQDRLFGPLGRKRVRRRDAVQRVEHAPGAPRDVSQALLDVLDRLVHMPPKCPTGALSLTRTRPNDATVRISSEPTKTGQISANWPIRRVKWRQKPPIRR